MSRVAQQFFPADLLGDLPGEVLRTVLESMPLAQRAELIYSQADENKSMLYNAIGATGRVREIVDTEIEEIEANDSRARVLQRNSDRLWQEFIDRTRRLIRSDVKVQDEVMLVLESWITSKTGVSFGQELGRVA